MGGPDRVTDRPDRAGHDDDVPAPDPGPLVAGEPPGQTHVALGGAGGIPGHGGVDAVAPDEQVRDRLDGRRTEPHVPGARADGDDDVLGRWGAEQPDRPRGRLLEGLEQRIGGALGEPVGVFDEDDPPAPDRGSQPTLLDQLAGLLHLDRQALGRQNPDVGVRALQRGPAFAALPAPT
jgi:hypothetical protein